MTEINKNVFRTVERRAALRHIAQRYHALALEYPDVNAARMVNLLNAEAIVCSEADLQEALQFETIDRQALAPAAVVDAALDTKAAAEYVGMPLEQFKGWFMPSYAQRYQHQTDAAVMPAGTPVPTRVKTAHGTSAYWDRASLDTLKMWLESNHHE